MRSKIRAVIQAKIIIKDTIVLTIDHIMNRQVKTLGPGATVADAIRFLTQHHIGGVPVVADDGTLVGMISELALIDVVFDKAVEQRPVSKYMAVDVYFVQPDDPISRAAELFTLYAFRRLPVVVDGKLVGIVTRRDIMNHALQWSGSLVDPLMEIFPSLAGANQHEPSLQAQSVSADDTLWD